MAASNAHIHNKSAPGQVCCTVLSPERYKNASCHRDADSSPQIQTKSKVGEHSATFVRARNFLDRLGQANPQAYKPAIPIDGRMAPSTPHHVWHYLLDLASLSQQPFFVNVMPQRPAIAQLLSKKSRGKSTGRQVRC